MGDQSFTEPVAQMCEAVHARLNQRPPAYCTAPKSNAGGGEIDIDFIHLILRNFGQISFHHPLHSAYKSGQGQMPGSTLALYRVILCATDITKGNDEYATSCWTRVASLRCACRDVNRGGRLRPRSPAAAAPDRRGWLSASPQTLTPQFFRRY